LEHSGALLFQNGSYPVFHFLSTKTDTMMWASKSRTKIKITRISCQIPNMGAVMYEHQRCADT